MKVEVRDTPIDEVVCTAGVRTVHLENMGGHWALIIDGADGSQLNLALTSKACTVVEHSRAPARERIEIRVPWRLKSALNRREHWAARATRVKKERADAALAFSALRGLKGVERVRFTRHAPRSLDDGDNLASAFKGIRDEVALLLGVSDARSGGVAWEYDEQKASEHLVTVTVTRRIDG